MTAARIPVRKISAVVSDVDGTLVTKDKALTDRAASAVRKLRDSGIKFTIVSSRPPRGMRSLIEEMQISESIAGFNGGVIATPSLTVLKQHFLDPEIARRAVELIESRNAHAWVFAGERWFIRERDAPHVAHEEHTVGFGPTIVQDFSPAVEAAAKIVAVSKDPDLLVKLTKEVKAAFGSDANVVQSQSYYLDLTHSLANKGVALRELAKAMSVPLDEVAVIGDGANDVDMFAPSGLSIAMGNGSDAVRGAADFVTVSNNDDGFAKAIQWFILGQKRTVMEERKPIADASDDAPSKSQIVR